MLETVAPVVKGEKRFAAKGVQVAYCKLLLVQLTEGGIFGSGDIGRGSIQAKEPRMARNKPFEERVKALVAELLAEDKETGQYETSRTNKVRLRVCCRHGQIRCGARTGEDRAGAWIARVTVNELDAGDTHSFIFNDPRFGIVAGNLHLKATEQIDLATETSVVLEITATDAGAPGLSKTVAFTLTMFPATTN
jgi:hypothetical protein